MIKDERANVIRKSIENFMEVAPKKSPRFEVFLDTKDGNFSERDKITISEVSPYIVVDVSWGRAEGLSDMILKNKEALELASALIAMVELRRQRGENV